MTTYNKSNIMTHAWRMFRNAKNWKFSTCLKKAWGKAKTASKGIRATVVRETEKAVLVNVKTTYKRSLVESNEWMPKSVFENLSNLALSSKGEWMLKCKVAERMNGIPTRVSLYA